jgi:hypothetical protein
MFLATPDTCAPQTIRHFDCFEFSPTRDREGKAMAKIVKEPFSPKRRNTYKSESLIGLIGWWRAFLRVVSLIFLKGQTQ